MSGQTKCEAVSTGEMWIGFLHAQNHLASSPFPTTDKTQQQQHDSEMTHIYQKWPT